MRSKEVGVYAILSLLRKDRVFVSKRPSTQVKHTKYVFKVKMMKKRTITINNTITEIKKKHIIL